LEFQPRNTERNELYVAGTTEQIFVEDWVLYN